MNRRQLFLLSFLALAVVSSGIGVVYAKFLSRKQFVELQVLRKERDAVDVEWGRLQLQQGAYAAHGEVERIARTQLKMHVPRAHEVVVVTP